MCSKCFTFIFFAIVFECLASVQSDVRQGPDPWDMANTGWQKKSQKNENVPPDLRIPVKKISQPTNSLGNGEWFFRRVLNIFLKGGKLQQNSNDDGMEILLNIRLSSKQWIELNEFLKSNNAFTDDVYRRILGYMEEAVKPTFTDKITMAWTDYIQSYLVENKLYITWTLSLMATGFAFAWLSKRISHKHLIIALFLLLYMYEVFVSYKEAEKKELDEFLSALDSCNWKFWTSNCEVPKPDLVALLKHMNPMKIGVRMFTNLMSEPMISLSETVKVMIHGMTDGLWYPFDKIMYGVLSLSLHVLMIVLLIMIVFNYIFNIEFNLSYFGVGLGILQRNRNIFTSSNCSHNVENVDRISGQTLDRLLDVFSRALPVVQNSNHQQPKITNHASSGLRRSASTGRLRENANSSYDAITYNRDHIPRKRHVKRSPPTDGSGDASFIF